MSNRSTKTYYIVFTFYFIVFGIIVAFVTSFVNYRIHYIDIYKQISQTADNAFMEKAFFLDSRKRHLSLVARSFTNSDLLLRYIRSKSAEDQYNVKMLFYAAASSNPDFMQVRYIDETGMEKVRVDRILNELRIIPDNEMQNKADRYYFREASLVRNKEIWESKIDLNIEHGKIEVPLKPTFRIATPVYLDDKFKGIVIINLLMNNLLNSLSNVTNFSTYIIDGEGEILKSPDPNESWSRYLEGRYNFSNISDELPDILKNDKYHCNHLFSYNLEEYISNGENIHLVMMPKQSTLENMRRNNTSAALLIAAIVLAVSVPLSWIAAYIPSKLSARLSTSNYQLNKFHSIMDKYLITATTDKNQVITSCSKAFTDITEYTAEEMIGQTNKIIRHPDNSLDIYNELWDTITAGKVWEGELRCISKSGRTFWLHKIISPDLDENGNITGYTSIDYDCTDAKMIEEMSITDQLTGLYNRRRLDETLETEMVRFNRYKHNFCAILLDIDHFKNVNDTYGHSEGDRVLKELADILKANTRATDTVGRWGGEEFLIIAAETDISQCAQLAEKIRAAVQDHYFGNVGRVTISLGTAQYKYGDTIAHFIVNADSALYKAKQNGRNRVELHNG